MHLFLRIYNTPVGVNAWCEGCGNCLEASSTLGLVAAILDHLRRKHKKEYADVTPDLVARNVIDARKAVA
jgi:hypothetical protein